MPDSPKAPATLQEEPVDKQEQIVPPEKEPSETESPDVESETEIEDSATIEKKRAQALRLFSCRCKKQTAQERKDFISKVRKSRERIFSFLFFFFFFFVVVVVIVVVVIKLLQFL